MHIFHKWGKWSEYDQAMISHPAIISRKDATSYEFTQIMQRRECEVCGKAQREKVKGAE